MERTCECGVSEQAPQHVSQWYRDYFELKAVLAEGSRETSVPLFNYLEELELGSLPIKDYH